MFRALFLFLSFVCLPLTATAGSREARLSRVNAFQTLWATGDFMEAADYFNAALAQSPDDYETNLDYGLAYLTYCQPPNYKEAKKLVEKAAKIKKDVFNQYILSDIIYLNLGDFAARDKCRVAIQELLRTGRDRDVQETPPDMEFGRQQYKSMLESIPVMKLYVPKQGWLSTWAAEKFAGVGLRNHILWEYGKQEISNVPAVTGDDVDGAGDMTLFIGPDEADRTGKTGFREAESYWLSFIYEMLNDQHRERTTWIWMRCRSGKMTGLEYAILTRAFEEQTDYAVSQFYFEHWKPYCEKMNLPTDEAMWCPGAVYPEAALYDVFVGADTVYQAYQGTTDKAQTRPTPTAVPLEYRHAEAGVKVTSVRPFLNVDSTLKLDNLWCDSGSGATISARVGSDRIEYRYDTGKGWGCGSTLVSNHGPFVTNSVIDVRGYDYLQFKAKTAKNTKFYIHFSEDGIGDPHQGNFKGAGGADGETFTSLPLLGTGNWETYRVGFASMTRRRDWGNQNGDGILDLQAIASLDLEIWGGQGVGTLSIQDIEFRPGRP